MAKACRHPVCPDVLHRPRRRACPAYVDGACSMSVVRACLPCRNANAKVGIHALQVHSHWPLQTRLVTVTHCPSKRKVDPRAFKWQKASLPRISLLGLRDILTRRPACQRIGAQVGRRGAIALAQKSGGVPLICPSNFLQPFTLYATSFELPWTFERRSQPPTNRTELSASCRKIR